MLKVRFITCVWGDKYIENFLNFSICTQLGLGNIPDSKIAPESDYFIMSDNEGISKLEIHPNIELLRLNINVTFFDISEIPKHNKYIAASHCQHQAILRSKNFDNLLFIYPDFLCSTGTIKHAIDKLNEGFEAIAYPIPMILPRFKNDEKFSTFINDTSLGRTISIPPRKLVELSLAHHHPLLDGYFIQGSMKNEGHAYLQWKINPSTWLFHCFHLHPLAVKVKKDLPEFRAKFEVSLDEEFFPRVYDDLSKIYFPESSDDYAMLSISDYDDLPIPKPGSITLNDILSYAENDTRTIHREMISKPFIWTSQSPAFFQEKTEYKEVQEQALTLIDIIKRELNTPDNVLQAQKPHLYSLRMQRHTRLIKNSKMKINKFYEDDEIHESYKPEQPDLLNILYSKVLSFFVWLKNNTPLRKLKAFPFLVSLWLKFRRMLTKDNI